MLIAELQNQDPTQPVDNTQILQEVSQIENIVTNENLNTTLESVALEQSMATASSLLNKTVTADGRLREHDQRPGQQHLGFQRHRHDQRQRNDRPVRQHYLDHILLSRDTRRDLRQDGRKTTRPDIRVCRERGGHERPSSRLKSRQTTIIKEMTHGFSFRLKHGPDRHGRR